jgi:hypothetical protein
MKATTESVIKPFHVEAIGCARDADETIPLPEWELQDKW